MQITMPETLGSGIVINLVADVLFVSIVAIARWLVSRISKGDPRFRKLGISIVAVLWIVSNALYFLCQWPFQPLFLLVTTSACACFGFLELYQFWRVDLVGADTRMSEGLNCKKALTMCTTGLDFLGIGASKLTNDQSHFGEAVSRCARHGRPIRLLLSRPESDGLCRIARQADTDPAAYQRRVRESLHAIALLKSQEKNLQVKFYKDFPAFRLMFINDQVLLASHYALGKGDGSQMPQLHIIKTSKSNDINSLYYGFQAYFDGIWEDSDEWNFQDYL